MAAGCGAERFHGCFLIAFRSSRRAGSTYIVPNQTESGAHARDHRLMSVFVFKDSSAEEDSTWSMPLMSARAGEERWSGKVTAPLRMRCLVASSVSAWNGVQPHSISYTA